MSALVLLLPLAAICIVVCGAAAAVLELLTRPLSRLLTGRRRAPSALCAAVLLLPWLAGILTVAALLVPSPLAGCHCQLHALDHPHLCPHHPLLALPLLPPACAVLTGWLLLALPRILRFGGELRASARWVDGLRLLPSASLDGVSVRLRDGDSLEAFTAGVLAPIVVVDRALWRVLPPSERRAVVHHERAHAARRDGLTLVVLRACGALSLWPLGEPLIDSWKAACEAACDREAALAVGDARTVARALIALSRARAALRSGATPVAPMTSLAMAPGAQLERRVHDLLDATGPKRAALGNDVVAASIVILGATVVALAWPGSIFHHAVETAVGVFFH